MLCRIWKFTFEYFLCWRTKLENVFLLRFLESCHIILLNFLKTHFKSYLAVFLLIKLYCRIFSDLIIATLNLFWNIYFDISYIATEIIQEIEESGITAFKLNLTYATLLWRPQIFHLKSSKQIVSYNLEHVGFILSISCVKTVVVF